MLSLVLHFIASVGIADPCISGKPFMRRLAVWTIGVAEKNRAGAERCGVHVSASGNGLPRFRATNHKKTHEGHSQRDCRSAYRSSATKK